MMSEQYNYCLNGSWVEGGGVSLVGLMSLNPKP